MHMMWKINQRVLSIYATMKKLSSWVRETLGDAATLESPKLSQVTLCPYFVSNLKKCIGLPSCTWMESLICSVVDVLYGINRHLLMSPQDKFIQHCTYTVTVHLCAWTFVHRYASGCASGYSHTSMGVLIYSYGHTCTYVNICACMSKCTCVCYTCPYIFICAHKPPHKYING